MFPTMSDDASVLRDAQDARLLPNCCRSDMKSSLRLSIEGMVTVLFKLLPRIPRNRQLNVKYDELTKKQAESVTRQLEGSPEGVYATLKYGAVLLALACSLIGKAQAQPSLTNGLVAYYPLNGDATDASGNGNDGTAYGVAWVSDRFGNTNAACRFYGNSGSYVDIQPSISLNFPEEITVATWCVIDGTGTYTPRLISIDKVGAPDSGSYQLAASPGAGGTATFVFLDLVDGVGFSPQWTGNVTNGQWVHLAAVGTRTNASLYVNGVLVATQSGPAINPAPQPTLLNLGRLTVPSFDAFDGVMDEVRVYNRVLSDLEIQQLRDYGIPSLNINLSGQFVLVWWPTNSAGFQLETSPRIGTDQNWTTYSGPITVIGEQNVVVADATSGSRYFRLRWP